MTHAREPLQILYESRAFFSYKNADGKLVGILIQAVEPALKKAGIPFVWVETPFNRQLKIVEDNREPVCAAGLFMTAERKRYAKFSSAVLHEVEQSSIILSHQDFKIPPKLDLIQVLSLPNVRLLKKENASYGGYIDDAIQRSKVRVIGTSAEPKNMAKMIVAKRADFIFVSDDEAQLIMRETEGGQQLRTYQPTGMPHGQDRFLMCSQRVTNATLDRFNRALLR